MTAYIKAGHPFAKIKVKLPHKHKWLPIECLVDTGFSGGLSLPKSYIDNFPKNKLVEVKFELADGSRVKTNAAITQVNYNGDVKDVAVVFLGNSESLLGVEFLDQMRFCLDLKDNKIELE